MSRKLNVKIARRRIAQGKPVHPGDNPYRKDKVEGKSTWVRGLLGDDPSTIRG
jgi:hypothetical protein